jgi:Helix-turn-helix domain
MIAASATRTATTPTAPVVPLRPHTFRVDNALIDEWGERIGATAVALYCALSRYANRHTGECWPSIATLATKLKLGRNTVKKYLRVLAQHHLITWQPHWGAAGDQGSHRYTVHPCPAPSTGALASAGGRAVVDRPPVHTQGRGRSAADPEQDLEQEKRTSAPIFHAAVKNTPKPLPSPSHCTGPHDWHRLGELTHCCKHCEAHHPDCRCMNCRVQEAAADHHEAPQDAAQNPLPEPCRTTPPSAGDSKIRATRGHTRPLGPRPGDDLLRQYATAAAPQPETPEVVIIPYCPAEA